MKQCMKVLKTIQPASRKAWEQACHDDLRSQGAACLYIDMNIAIDRCGTNGLAVESGGQWRLAPGQRRLWAALRKTCDTIASERKNLDDERRHQLMSWIDTKSDRAIRMALRKIARCEEYDSNGHRVWENLKATLSI